MAEIRVIGKRVIVADLMAEDIPQYYEWFWESNPETMSCRKIERKPIDEVVEHMKGHFEKKDVLFLAIRRREDDAFMGRLTLFDQNDANRSIEIGYMIGPPYRNQGYTSEAIQLLLRHVFESMKLNKVHAQTGEFNTGSIRMLEKLGFQREGRLRQHHLLDGVLYDDLIYSLLAEEYSARGR